MPAFAIRTLALLLSSAVTVAFAQPATPTPATPDFKTQIKELAKRHAFDEGFMAELNEELAGLPASHAFIANEFGHPREIVKNAPYTAEAVTETIQVLPDGN